MNNSKSTKSLKIIILCFSFLFIFGNLFNKNNANTFTIDDSAFPTDQTVTGPNFFPFSNSQNVVDIFNQQGCSNTTFLFDGPPSLSGITLEVGPAANGFETGSRDILVFDPNGNLIFTEASFPLTNPNTLSPFDPSMGDILGLSIVPGSGFPGSVLLMIETTINCDDGMSSTSTSTSGTVASSSGSTTSSSGSVTSSGTVSSSGIVLTDGQVISSAISTEKSAKKSISLKDLAMGGSGFSVSMALDDLMSSISSLQDLSNRLSDSDAMIAMASIQSKIDEVISGDNEAIMALEPFKDVEPSITNGELTTAVTRANMILSEILRIKERIEAKIKKEDKTK